MKALLAVALLAGLALAGCGEKGGDPPPSATTGTTGPLASGKGAISGLLINDVFRPVPGGLVLIQELGLTATSDSSGQFAFIDLDPGSYLLRVQVDGHEAAPQSIDVKEGEYAEAELMARRVASEAGRVVTTEYSVFVSCAASAPVISGTIDCTFDQSGDSDRASFTSNYTAYGDATYLVTEMKSARPASSTSGAYKIVVRQHTDTDNYYASAFTADGDYIKVVMKLGEVSLADTEGRNLAWNNTEELQTAFFPQGAFKSETQAAQDAACQPEPADVSCFESRGIGPQAGVRAKFVQSLFIGEPEVDIETYCVLC